MYLAGNNTLTSPTIPTFAAFADKVMNTILILGTGKDQTTVDNILKAASIIPNWNGAATVDLSGGNSTPSAQGLISAATIGSKGATVKLN